MDVAWIIQPLIWEHAADRAARELPKWTKAWWRRATEKYIELGGRFFEGDEDGNGSLLH